MKNYILGIPEKQHFKRIQNRFAASPLKFLFLTCWEKDDYTNDNQHPENPQKIGWTYDCIKNKDYSMNLALRLGFEPGADGKKGPRFCDVTKDQGLLGRDFPMGKRFKEFPMDLIMKHAGAMGQTVPAKMENENDVASAVLDHEERQSEPRT